MNEDIITAFAKGPPPKPSYCIDCKHYFMKYCQHPALDNKCFVTGGVRHLLADEQRHGDGYCGKYGILWEAKEEKE